MDFLISQSLSTFYEWVWDWMEFCLDRTCPHLHIAVLVLVQVLPLQLSSLQVNAWSSKCKWTDCIKIAGTLFSSSQVPQLHIFPFNSLLVGNHLRCSTCILSVAGLKCLGKRLLHCSNKEDFRCCTRAGEQSYVAMYHNQWLRYDTFCHFWI